MRENLVNWLSVTKINTSGRSFDKFIKICGEVLHRHVPSKKYIRGNQLPFMYKTLSKEIMKKKQD